ncbi:unnamed protein product [Brassica oleracea]
MTDDGSSFDPNFTPLNTMDLESQRVLGVILAADEADDGSSDGAKKKQRKKRRLSEAADDEDDSDVEITPPPTQATTLRKQATCGTVRALKSKKPMLQSTLDGGIGSSSSPKASKRKTKTKSIHLPSLGGGGGKAPGRHKVMVKIRRRFKRSSLIRKVNLKSTRWRTRWRTRRRVGSGLMYGPILLRFKIPMVSRKLNAIIVRMTMHGLPTGMEQVV